MLITWQDEKRELLNVIYELVLNTTVTDDERELFLDAMLKLEKGTYYRQVVVQLKDTVRILGLKQQLSPLGSDFLLEIARKTASGRSKGALFDVFIP